jgi:ATP phosphoribosyltransferase regulatory subunit
MRDLLPPESRARRKVSEQLEAAFERYGYDLVTTPLFEQVEVFERGPTLDPRDLLRFVEPDSGQVAALRPDFTPQIARVVATRLVDYPSPFRLRYEGTVIRRRRGRARRQRQIAQVGVELIGISGVEADVEVVRLIAEGCRATGLRDFRIELSDVGVARSLLDEHAADLLERAAPALARKDERALDAVLASAGLKAKERARICALAHLHGDLSVLDEAERLVRGTTAALHVENLRAVASQLVAEGFGPQLGVDLGEIRGAGYYTGVSFALLAPGPGEAIASGGRYDQLLAQYGAAQPATGAGIDVENLLSALDAAGFAWRERDRVRWLVVGDAPARVEAVARSVRQAGVSAATLANGASAAADDYARAWGYDACLLTSADALSLKRADGATRELSAELASNDFDALSTWARSASSKE